MQLPSATALTLAPSSATPHARIETAARELETQFAQMLIKSMRSTTSGDPMMGDNTTYREMYDQQLAKTLTRGRGLGLAPMIMRQLERNTSPDPGTQAAPAALPLPAAVVARPMPLATPVTSNGALPALSLAPSHAGLSMSAVAAPLPPPVPQADPACGPDTPLDCSSPEAFVQSIWPHARKIASELGVSAKALVAQAALETGWGRRLAKAGEVVSHNLFGIKAGSRWSGDRVRTGTHEFVAGRRVQQQATFRAYASTGESFADYARLLGSQRYAAARGTGDDARGFAQALQRAGYATDPAYASKIAAIADGPTLRRALAALPPDVARG